MGEKDDVEKKRIEADKNRIKAEEDGIKLEKEGKRLNKKLDERKLAAKEAHEKINSIPLYNQSIERDYEKCQSKTASQLSSGEETFSSVINKFSAIMTTLTGQNIKQIGGSGSKKNPNPYNVSKYGKGIRIITDINMGNNKCQDVENNCSEETFNRYHLTTPEQSSCGNENKKKGLIYNAGRKIFSGIKKLKEDPLKLFNEGLQPKCTLVKVNTRIPNLQPDECKWNLNKPFNEDYVPIYMTLDDIEHHYKTCGNGNTINGVKYQPCIMNKNDEEFDLSSIIKLKAKGKKCSGCDPASVLAAPWKSCSGEKKNKENFSMPTTSKKNKFKPLNYEILEKESTAKNKKKSQQNLETLKSLSTRRNVIFAQSIIGGGITLYILYKLLNKNNR